jgi:hypothetical protein
MLPKDVRARVDLASAVDPLDAVTQGTVDAGMGLGNGYVAHRSYVQYTHTFAPTESVDSIVSASLSIAIWDDQLFEFEPETVTISLDGELWKKNQATWAYLHDSVSAHLFEEDGEFKVTVFATQGDTQIGWSFFSATYLTPDVSTSGGGVSPMPEPGGVALFYSGLLVFGTVRSRMRSGPRS